MTQEIANRRAFSGFDVFIALVNGAIAVAFIRLAFEHWQHGEIDDALRPIGMTLFLIMASLLMLSRLRKHLIAKDIVSLLGICSAWFACYWHRRITITFKVLLVLLLLLVAWRVTFHLRGWRIKRKIRRNLSRIESLTRGSRTGTTCRRLSPSAILLSMAVFLSFLLLMVLRYWRVGDGVSSIALGAVFLYVGVNAVSRFLERRQPPGEVKEFRDRHMYTLLAISAIHVAIFGFVAIRGWQRDGSLFWSGLCWAVSLIDASLSTFVAVLYFRTKKGIGAIATQTARPS
jgi:hypothetical protein